MASASRSAASKSASSGSELQSRYRPTRHPEAARRRLMVARSRRDVMVGSYG
ncbi:hypothetical protein SCE1572_21110 [Sorangium cellulosum So0157-2]|uniref:Uncharacterized protein n=1 Tax=Sorangium cellulosum So0157-2 TaxID=1254432 RepID=S4XWL9_SORCE|nr:hypothetical protein SCE1572_21110 [Sorangium cellulosum So0157-2]